MKRAEGLAIRVAHNYITVEATRAVQEAQDKVHGKGCRCGSCLHSAAARANSWVDFVTKGDTPEIYKFHVRTNGRGKLEITQGTDEET